MRTGDNTPQGAGTTVTKLHAISSRRPDILCFPAASVLVGGIVLQAAASVPWPSTRSWGKSTATPPAWMRRTTLTVQNCQTLRNLPEASPTTGSAGSNTAQYPLENCEGRILAAVIHSNTVGAGQYFITRTKVSSVVQVVPTCQELIQLKRATLFGPVMLRDPCKTPQ